MARRSSIAWWRGQPSRWLDLRVFPAHTRANFVPTFLTQGKRFAIVLQTAGNHFTVTLLGNKYAQGMLFIGTPAGWAMGDVERDIPFQLNFAEFDVPRVAVQLQPLELQNGIAAMDINVDSIRPPACNTSFEVRSTASGRRWERRARMRQTP